MGANPPPSLEGVALGGYPPPARLEPLKSLQMHLCPPGWSLPARQTRPQSCGSLYSPGLVRAPQGASVEAIERSSGRRPPTEAAPPLCAMWIAEGGVGWGGPPGPSPQACSWTAPI